MIPNPLPFKNNLVENKVKFSFIGPINQSILETIGQALRSKIASETNTADMTLKVFAVFVEQVQNIIFYSAQLNSSADFESESDMIVIGAMEEDAGYYILSGNSIEKKFVPDLEKLLLKIKNMDKKEIRAFYRERRRNPAPERSRGAGLGLLEMARKATAPLEYQINEIDEEYAFVFIKASIANQKEEPRTGGK